MSRKHRFLTTVATATLVVIGSIGTAAYAPQAAAVPLPSDFNWTLVSTTGGPPQYRCYGTSAVYDAVGDHLIVFGGNNCGATLNETWVLSNASGVGGPSVWSPGPPGPMATRANHSAVYDAATDRMIVFAGCNGGCLPTLNDTWVLVNATGVGGPPSWMPLAAANAPSPRNNHRAVYDPNTNRMILWSGQNGGGGLCCGQLTFDVWVLTNANGLGGAAVWTQLAPSGGPPPGAYIGSASYDPTANTLTVFGGTDVNGTPTNAVWVLSDANGIGSPAWTNTVAEGAPGSPSPRTTAGTVIDLANNRLMNFGGAALDTWVLTNANGNGGPSVWTQLATTGTPPAGTGIQSLTYDPNTNQMLAFVADSTGTAVQVWRLSNANGIAPPPPATAVQVGLRGRFKKTPINIRQKGRVPMTVFGSATFNVADIDQGTVTFGATGTESTPVPGTAQFFDVNKDTYPDLIFQFPKSSTATPCGTTSVTIKGELTTGGSFQGSDSAKVVPCAPPPT